MPQARTKKGVTSIEFYQDEKKALEKVKGLLSFVAKVSEDKAEIESANAGSTAIQRLLETIAKE